MIKGPLRKFCENIAKGMTGEEAWLKSHPKCAKGSARAQASKALTNDNVQREIESLRKRADEKAGGAVLTLAEKRAFLARIVRLQGADFEKMLDENPDLINGIRLKTEGREFIIPCKLKALELDAKLNGEFAEDKNDKQAVDTLTAFMQGIAVRK